MEYFTRLWKAQTESDATQQTTITGDTDPSTEAWIVVSDNGDLHMSQLSTRDDDIEHTDMASIREENARMEAPLASTNAILEEPPIGASSDPSRNLLARSLQSDKSVSRKYLARRALQKMQQQQQPQFDRHPANRPRSGVSGR
eukprot:m.220891 g.220891  ORF g.220891 m.220891 type:complete len:143 (+) comp10476_c0_seq1:2088-2516(+)